MGRNQRLVGIPATDGIAWGTAHLLDRRRVRVPRRHLTAAEVQAECARLDTAVQATDDQLQRIQDRLADVGGDTLILDAHRLIAGDPFLVDRTKRIIRGRLINAEWALSDAVRDIREVFEQVDDSYFRERRSDVDFGARHLLVTLLGNQPVEEELPSSSLVVAHDLSPIDIARLYRDGVKGFVTTVGGKTSHAAIMARSLGIVAVVGVQGASTMLASGDFIIVDGNRGEVLVCPDEAILREYQRSAGEREARVRSLCDSQNLPAVTRDGVRIKILANVEVCEEVPLALQSGVDGIGLYRTEFLYLGRDTLPSEEEHRIDATRMLDSCPGLPVTFRTCDIGSDGQSAVPVGEEPNPAMGVRAIRLCLRQPEAFGAQLRGILRGANGGPVSLMFPMVCSLSEVREAKRILQGCIDEVDPKPSQVRVGTLVETPSAALIADQLASEVDFFAIGTNDLIQYTLGVDRINEQVSYLYTPLHPAVLRLIRTVVDAAQVAAIPVSLCGEMAGNAMLSVLLLGLGVRELSMGAASVLQVKRVIRETRIADARALAERALVMGSADEIEMEVRRTMRNLFPELDFGSRSEEDTP